MGESERRQRQGEKQSGDEDGERGERERVRGDREEEKEREQRERDRDSVLGIQLLCRKAWRGKKTTFLMTFGPKKTRMKREKLQAFQFFFSF